jgi:hypothetical protein
MHLVGKAIIMIEAFLSILKLFLTAQRHPQSCIFIFLYDTNHGVLEKAQR